MYANLTAAENRERVVSAIMAKGGVHYLVAWHSHRWGGAHAAKFADLDDARAHLDELRSNPDYIGPHLVKVTTVGGGTFQHEHLRAE